MIVNLILKDGNITLKKDGKQIKSLQKGDYCGVLEVLANSNRITEAVPKEKTHTLTLPVFWLKSLYGDNYRSVLALALIKSAFNNDSNLKTVTFEEAAKQIEVENPGRIEYSSNLTK